MNWHTKEIEEIFKILDTDINGLASEEAKRRLTYYGLNEIKSSKKKHPFSMFLNQFKDLMIIILIISAIIASILGKVVDSSVIIAIVILNAFIGFLQEYKAEKAIESLKKLAIPIVTVIRDGKTTNIPSTELVPGDVVFLEAGQIVPADMRLIESVNLKIDESILTGESIPIEKDTIKLNDPNLPLGERKNMVYQGTIVTYGRAKGLVISTGMDTEIGKIAKLLQDERDVKTPLQKRLSSFSKKLAFVILIISLIVFLAGIIKGEDVVFMLLTSISLAVAAIPEALPAVITIALAISAKKLVKQNSLIRKLPAVETLGSITYICSDKTGTLTLNKMTVEEIFINNKIIKIDEITQQKIDDELKKFFTIMSLCNDIKKDKNGKAIGDPTEIAIYELTEKKGFNKELLDKRYPRVAEIPFDSDRKCMTTIHLDTDGMFNTKFIAITKGAVENLLSNAKNIKIENKLININLNQVHKIIEKMTSNGLRVLAYGIKLLNNLPENLSPLALEKDLTLIGFIGMMDPPREEVKSAVYLCKKAGITPVMITGDHPITAMVIAKRLGILPEEGDTREVITGRELEKIPEDEFRERVEKILVYARVVPEQKLKIVKALQSKGQFVAMTGDGVNDAPALKHADIGIAMGINGTDVSKESASMILLDDNFATIVNAIKEGRRIFDNILKFIVYSMTSNAGTLCAIFLSPFFALPLPLLPVQILWMNLLTDSLPGLSLTAELPERNIMERPPKDPKEGIFSNGRGLFILKYGLIIGVLALLFQYFSFINGFKWQTMIFSALVISRMSVVLSVRSFNDSILKIGFFTNKPLLLSIFITVILQLVIIYTPFFNTLFHTQPLNLKELFFTFMFPIIILLIIEIEKKINNLKKYKPKDINNF